MRFIDKGPSIPDDLLIARDEGRVVFICGSGVSAANAKLPDFFGLAEKVLNKLGVPTGSDIRKVTEEFKALGKRLNITGLVGVDRIFGLLEREFTTQDIEIAVAQTLKPKPGVNLAAHRTILDLATTPEGKLHLVTTNFDRLFTDCRPEAAIMKHPRLPDPSNPDEFDGIIYLHGCCNERYSEAEDGGFVLTSSGFGKAYLTEGWATAFIRKLIDKYTVVFVGYSADDPPVQYLLEALDKYDGSSKKLYAFQSGKPDEALAQWRPKGVEAIPYERADRHRTLWDTLNAWADRANAVDDWYQSVLEMAVKGPENLKPYERGQVAHIVSTLDGARMFMKHDPPLPGAWLCVFDPKIRYSIPGGRGVPFEQEPYVDPYNYYCIDSDEVPKIIDQEDYRPRRNVPEDAWSAFDATRLDRDHLRGEHYPAFGGFRATMVPALPPRLDMIGAWIR